MERLTIKYNGQYVPKKMCAINRFGEIDGCALCAKYCGLCNNCTDKE